VERLKDQGKDYGVTAEELRRGVEQDAFEIQASSMLSLDVTMQAEDFVPIPAEMRWTLVTASDGLDLPTSDHPVIRQDPDAQSPFRYGLASATLEFGLPFSTSKFLLIGHDFERERRWAELVERPQGSSRG
jgi:hypothetical protein